jgi:crotonobetainyl-CoA hydratase
LVKVSGILFEVKDHVARITINRPQVLNAIDPATEQELFRTWEEIERNREVRVVVLRGAGERAFCVGADMSAQGVERTGLEYWAFERPGGFGGIAMRRSLKVPVIAAVNGYALGGGMEMVLGCDIVVAAEEALFGLTEPLVGRIPLDGGVYQLTRQVPLKQAMGLLLTAKKFPAVEGYRLGLVNEVVPRAELDQATERWVQAILACAPLSLQAIKEMVLRTPANLPAEEANRLRWPALVEALQSEDAQEGVKAFQEKRKPVWKGR